ncbi:MAG: hypothetical protein AAGA68_23660 [Pseudomonadota bacterium]
MLPIDFARAAINWLPDGILVVGGTPAIVFFFPLPMMIGALTPDPQAATGSSSALLPVLEVRFARLERLVHWSGLSIALVTLALALRNSWPLHGGSRNEATLIGYIARLLTRRLD